jgi:hypothetical protein
MMLRWIDRVRRVRRTGWMLAAAGMGLVTAAEAGAVSISIEPESKTVQSGDVVVFDVLAADLGDGIAPSVGSFDFDITFDESLLAVSDVSFGSFLGEPGSTAFTSWSVAGGLLEISEVSLLAPGTLNAAQPPEFVLASFSVDVLVAASSTLDFSSVLVGSAEGPALSVTSVFGANTAPIPEPAGAALFVLGSLMTGWTLRRRAMRTVLS